MVPKTCKIRLALESPGCLFIRLFVVTMPEIAQYTGNGCWQPPSNYIQSESRKEECMVQRVFCIVDTGSSLTEICFASCILHLYLWELHKDLPTDAIVIKHNWLYQNTIFSARDCQRSMMETSVLGFMRFDNIGFATSALAWPHQRALQQAGREGQDCTDGTDGRSFQIRKVTRLQSYKMHTFAHK